MQIRIPSLASFNANFLQNKLLPSLSPLQQKIILIAIGAFTCLAGLYLLSRYYFNKKPQSDVKSNVEEAKKEDQTIVDKIGGDPVSDKVDATDHGDPQMFLKADEPFVPKARPNLYTKFVPPAYFTPAETECARNVIGKWMHTQYEAGYAFSCPGMQDYLVEHEQRKKVMNYLLKEGFFEAWAFGYSGVPLVKTFLTDKLPPMKADNTPERANGFQYLPHPTSWRTRQTLKNEAEFIKKNWIDPARFSEDELKKEFPDDGQRDVFFKAVKDLNTRVNDRPHPITNYGQERQILDFLLKKKHISKIEEKELASLRANSICPGDLS